MNTNNTDILFWQNKIHSEIPATRLLDFQISTLSPSSIKASAPLTNNINGHGTGFAGSIYTLAMTCGWVLVNHQLRCLGLKCAVVAGEANIRYMHPVQSDFFCQSELDAPEEQKITWQSFWQKDRAAKQRIQVAVYDIHRKCAELTVTYFIKPPLQD